jgi:hypothetical protein
MGKSRGLRRVSFSSSGAIRTTCLFALRRLLETTLRESNIGKETREHLQRLEDVYVAVADDDGGGGD